MNLMEQPQTHKNDPYNPDIFDQNIQNKHLELFKPYRVPRERCCQSLFGCTNKIAKKERGEVSKDTGLKQTNAWQNGLKDIASRRHSKEEIWLEVTATTKYGSYQYP